MRPQFDAKRAVAEGFAEWLAQKALPPAALEEIGAFSLPAHRLVEFTKEEARAQFPFEMALEHFLATGRNPGNFRSPTIEASPVCENGGGLQHLVVQETPSGWEVSPPFDSGTIAWRISWYWEPRDADHDEAVEVYDDGRVHEWPPMIVMEEYRIAAAVRAAREELANGAPAETLHPLAESAELSLEKLLRLANGLDPLPEGCRELLE